MPRHTEIFSAIITCSLTNTHNFDIGSVFKKRRVKREPSGARIWTRVAPGVPSERMENKMNTTTGTLSYNLCVTATSQKTHASEHTSRFRLQRFEDLFLFFFDFFFLRLFFVIEALAVASVLQRRCDRSSQLIVLRGVIDGLSRLQLKHYAFVSSDLYTQYND